MILFYIPNSTQQDATDICQHLCLTLSKVEINNLLKCSQIVFCSIFSVEIFQQHQWVFRTRLTSVKHNHTKYIIHSMTRLDIRNHLVKQFEYFLLFYICISVCAKLLKINRIILEQFFTLVRYLNALVNGFDGHTKTKSIQLGTFK